MFGFGNDDGALLEPKNQFANPHWDNLMKGGDLPVPYNEMPTMLRYLYAKIEMLEERLAKLEKTDG